MCVHSQSCPILYDPMASSPPDPSVHGIFQTRVLEWIAIPLRPSNSTPPCVCICVCVCVYIYIYIWRVTLIKKYICNLIFIEALFKIAKIWKQPKSPSEDQ